MNRSAKEAAHAAELAQARAERAKLDEKISNLRSQQLKAGIKESKKLELQAEIKSLEAQKLSMRLRK